MGRLSRVIMVICAVVLGATTPSLAHPSPDSEVSLWFEPGLVRARLLLPVEELYLAWPGLLPLDDKGVPLVGDDALAAYVLGHIRPMSPDERPWAVVVDSVGFTADKVPDVVVTVTMTPPPGTPADRFTLHYDAIFHQVITHKAVVVVASDWRGGASEESPVVLATMRDRNPVIAVDRSQNGWFQGFAAVFRLGADHIAEGTDHLLFLFALLLPAPLAIVGGRWGRTMGVVPAIREIAKVVTAFTIGHSATLVLGSLGLVRAPEMLVEAVIAISILASAVHAFRPIFGDREAIIAMVFGFAHGLAFGTILAGFGFESGTLISGMIAFNLGIEAVQLVVVLLTMPWLMMLSRTAWYSPFRVLTASLISVAALGWLGERVFGWDNPVEPVVQGFASRSWALLLGLAVFALAARVTKRPDRKLSLRVLTKGLAASK